MDLERYFIHERASASRYLLSFELSVRSFQCSEVKGSTEVDMS